jgi:NAD(P)-dependent dehydrogenase (short-subunit alcohol dehydrogenase family)
MRFAGRRVLVTGAASGIGHACAVELAKQGATLLLADIDEAGVNRVAGEVGGRAFVIDLRSAEAIDALAAEVIESGGVDILISNAGVAVVAPLLETSDADWEWIAALNLWAPIRLVRALLPQMIEKQRGQIVLTASLAGLIGAPGMLAYTTTKFALVGFAEALRMEVARHGIDVTTVCPGYVRTNLHRATRYKNAGFEKFLDAPPSWYGVSSERAARTIVGAIAKRKPMVVFGVEKLGWWLKRLWPSAALRVTRWTAERNGVL